MSKNISIKINNGKQTVETIKLNTAAKKLVIKAQANVNYELIDDATQYAPEMIDTKRVGNDLHIAFEGTDINQKTDLVIEGYYDNDNTELLIGMAENGKYYAYVPQSGIESDAVTLLADQVFAPQALGGKELAAPFWLLNPNWLWLAAGALAIGGIAAAASGGGSGGAKPNLVSKSDGSVEVTPPVNNSTKSVEVSYTDESGNPKTVTLTKSANGKWVSSSPEVVVDSTTGKATIPADKVKFGSQVVAKAIDQTGQAGEEVIVDVVSQPTTPSAPTVVAQNDGSVEIAPSTDGSTKSVEVSYTDEAGNPKTATVTKGSDGSWTSSNPDVTVDPTTGKATISADKVKGGSEVVAKAVNEAGNPGEEVVVNTNNIADALDKVKAAEAAEKDAEKALADANGDQIISKEEADKLKDLNAKVVDAKKAADDAVKALPEGATDGTNTKDSLQGRVNDVNPVDVPGVTDANNNGIDDAVEVNSALEKVKAAEAAEKAAEDALVEANKDGVISQQEADELKALNAKAAETKAAADEAVKALPADAKDAEGNTPAKLQGRVDRLDGITVPDVTAAKVTIVNYTDDYNNKDGKKVELGTGTKTDDNTPTINGTTTLSSSKVYLYEVVDGTLTQLGETSADASGTWKFTPDWLTNREHTIYASSTEITSKNAAQSSIVIDVEGVTTPPTSVGAKGEYWSATTVGDINGDGYDDIGMGSWNAGKADAILGGKNLTLAGNNYIGSAVWHQAGVGDVNGDGYNDVLFGTAAEGGGAPRLYTGSSNGLVNTAGIGNGIPAAAGDVNGDGIVDMIVMGDKSSTVYYGSTNGIYTNKSGSLSFGYNSVANGPLHNPSWGAQQYAAGVGDFNGDGYNDVVTTNGIYFGSENGLSDLNKISFNHAVTSANAAGDVNGDGYADVVVVDSKYGNSYVLFGGKNKDLVSFSTIKGNGSVSGANGGFAISTTQGSLQTADYSNAVGVGDVNGDGLADVLITTYGNTGSGSSAKTQYTKYTTDSYIVYGKADLKTVDPSALGKKGIIVPNNQADGSSSVGMVDVNGDGLADIYVNSYNTSGKLFYGGSSLGAEPTVKGFGEINGNEHSNFIVGSADNDTIYGKGGADIIYAGSGDDRIVLNADNLGYLSKGFQTENAGGSAINEGKGRLARIDGGNGHNILAFEDDVTTVDLTKISNAGTGFMKTAVGMSRIANIDHVDLTGNANKLILEAKDVLDMNHDLRSYDKSSATHQLMVTGDTGDTVTIKDVANWNHTSTTTSVNGKTYHVYTSMVEHGAQLLVDEHVHVEFIA